MIVNLGNNYIFYVDRFKGKLYKNCTNILLSSSEIYENLVQIFVLSSSEI